MTEGWPSMGRALGFISTLKKEKRNESERKRRAG